MDYKEFQEKIPYDPGDIFWSHIDILRKKKTVSVNHKKEPEPKTFNQDSDNFKLNDKEKSPTKKKNVFMPYPKSNPSSKYNFKNFFLFIIKYIVIKNNFF